MDAKPWHVHAPHGKPIRELEVGVKIGSWLKQLKVVGDRYWDTSMGLMFRTDPKPFQTLPITYENAFGGVDESKANADAFPGNPVGTGYAKSRDQRIGRKLPNIEYPGSPTKKRKQEKNRVAGFGALCSHWAPRCTYGGTYDERWQEEQSPLYPVDFNPRFFQYAPEDQQLGSVFGGETVSLLNLTPGSGLFEFRMPEVELAFYTKIKHQVIPHRGNLQTLIIEPDVPRLQMVWYTSVPCHHREQDIEHTYITCKWHLNE